MAKVEVVLIILMCNCLVSTNSLPEDPFITYDVLYDSGIKSYSNERWTECSAFMLKAMEDYNFYHDNLANCRLACHNSTVFKVTNTYRPTSDLSFFKHALRMSDCIRRCKQKVFGGRPERIRSKTRKKKIMEEFAALKPYDYLQICAYKMEDYRLAMSAAYTFHLGNPQHLEMEKNVRFYQKMPQAKIEYFRDMEAKEYQNNYEKGVDEYLAEKYKTAVELIELGLKQYYEEAKRCQVLCEEAYDHEPWPDFYNAIADHYIGVLKCQQQCGEKMGKIHGTPVENYLPEHYNYLQFAYYKLDNIAKAAECSNSYLVFLPGDETMQNNAEYYYQSLDITENKYKPRQEAKQYHERQKQLDAFLMYVNTQYSRAKEDTDHYGRVVKEAEEILKDVPDPIRNQLSSTILELEKQHGYKIVKNEVDLNGPMRFAADNVMTSEECQTLMNLANQAGTVGDGYQDAVSDGRSPHTVNERFTGVTVNTAAQLAYSDKVKREDVSLYLQMAERSRHLVEKYFNLNQTLYFDYTHLVCRTALDENNLDRKDLSHPVHSDNCMIQPDGSCIKQRPAYIERDFSALLYLNGDFGGGEFFFTHTNLTLQAQMRPRCGRLVGFNSTNYHGVKAVLSGQRCAVAMWFTLDVKHRELAHDLAHHLINSIPYKKTSSRLQGEL